MLKAKKSLGQHFLRSENALRQIVENIKLSDKKNNYVFEIGPGEGVLTREIINAGYKVLAIEIDKEAIEYLKINFAKDIKSGKLKIIEKNCLDVNYVKEVGEVNKRRGISVPLAAHSPAPEYFLVGNIPYYITGAIFRHTFEQKILPTGAIFLIQKEVGERIVAGNKANNKESILSISVKIFGRPEIIDVVKAGSFSPPPKVDSVILKIENIKNPFIDKQNYDTFFSILKSAFHHKRKYALSNIKQELGDEMKIKMQGFIDEKDRAEDLPLSVWIKILESLN